MIYAAKFWTSVLIDLIGGGSAAVDAIGRAECWHHKHPLDRLWRLVERDGLVMLERRCGCGEHGVFRTVSD